MMRGKGNMCKRGKRRKGKRGGHTSNLGSSSNIGRVTDVSSLCLNCKRKEKTRRRKGVNKYMGLAVEKLYTKITKMK